MKIHKDYIVPSKIETAYILQAWTHEKGICLEISYDEIDYALKYVVLHGFDKMLLWNINKGNIGKNRKVTAENIKRVARELYDKNDI